MMKTMSTRCCARGAAARRRWRRCRSAATTMKKMLVLASTRPIDARQPMLGFGLARDHALADQPRDQHDARRSRPRPARRSAALAIGDEPVDRRSASAGSGRASGIHRAACGGGRCGDQARGASGLRRAPLVAARNSSSPTSARRQALAPARPVHAVQRIARIVLDRLDQRGMDIGLAAHRRRVAERLGDRLDHRLDADPRYVRLSSATARRR